MSEPISKRLEFDEQTIFTNPPSIFKELLFTFVLLIDWWYHWIIRRKSTNVLGTWYIYTVHVNPLWTEDVQALVGTQDIRSI